MDSARKMEAELWMLRNMGRVRAVVKECLWLGTWLSKKPSIIQVGENHTGEVRLLTAKARAFLARRFAINKRTIGEIERQEAYQRAWSDAFRKEMGVE